MVSPAKQSMQSKKNGNVRSAVKLKQKHEKKASPSKGSSPIRKKKDDSKSSRLTSGTRLQIMTFVVLFILIQ